MYERWWDLEEPPFLNNFDCRFFFESARTEEAIARIQFLVEQQRVCGVVTGAAGVGKSFTIRHALKNVRGQQPTVAIVDVAGQPYEDVLRDLAVALHSSAGDTDSPFVVWRSIIDQLAGAQMADARTAIVFDHVDQAGPGAIQVIERLLNLHGSIGGYTLIVACCQIAAPAIQQSADLPIRLLPMDEAQTTAYIADRLRIAGRETPIFDDEAIEMITSKSCGVPRIVNRLCEMSMLMTVSEQKQEVDQPTVLKAAIEILPNDAAA